MALVQRNSTKVNALPPKATSKAKPGGGGGGGGGSRLSQMQAKFQQRQLEEKEQKMVAMMGEQQQRTLQRLSQQRSAPSSLNNSFNLGASYGGGKVRQMFEEMRRNQNNNSGGSSSPAKSSPVGWDKSYPLDPIVRTMSSKSDPAGNRVTKTRGSSLDRSSHSQPSNMRRSRSHVAMAEKSNNSEVMNGRVRASVQPHQGAAQPNVSVVRRGPPAPTAPKKFTSNGPSAPTYHRQPEQEYYFGGDGVYLDGDDYYNGGVAPPRPPPTKPTGGTKLRQEQPAVKNGPMKTSPVKKPPMAAVGASKSKTGPQITPSTSNLPQCRYCGRAFNADRLGVHEGICSKSKSKKHKVFDSTKQRVQGTEAESFVAKSSRRKEPQKGKNNWRQKHEDFINTIRYAKKMQQVLDSGGKLADLPPPPSADYSDYVQCPYCKRKFSQQVAERHIPKCKSITSNK